MKLHSLFSVNYLYEDVDVSNAQSEIHQTLDSSATNISSRIIDLGFKKEDVRVIGVAENVEKDRAAGKDLGQRSEVEIKIRGAFLINNRPSVILVRIYDNDDLVIKFSSHLIDVLKLPKDGFPAGDEETIIEILKAIKDKIAAESERFEGLGIEKSLEPEALMASLDRKLNKLLCENVGDITAFLRHAVYICRREMAAFSGDGIMGSVKFLREVEKQVQRIIDTGGDIDEVKALYDELQKAVEQQEDIEIATRYLMVADALNPDKIEEYPGLPALR